MATIIDLVGNTPLVELKRLNPHYDHTDNPKVKIYGKLEGDNPGGSVKDRAALNMIKSAVERGDIKPGQKLIEATSGNTGIALAMIARQYDLEIELVLPKNSTVERSQTMAAYGAQVILLDGIEACRDYADEKGKEDGYFQLNQFGNHDNYKAHYKTTGPEIWRDTDGQVTHFVSSMGTTGTIMGTSMYLKEKKSDIQIVGCQPTEGSRIPGIRRWPKEYLPAIFDASRVDRVMDISTEVATKTARDLARVESIFGGMSSGGAASVAIKLADELEEGLIVFIVCDRGDRYLSSDLFK